MRNANSGLGDRQSNQGDSSALAIKTTTKMLIGLAVAGMVAMATMFGSASADSPAVSTSTTGHGPYQMDIDFLNKLGNVYFNLGPDIGVRTAASAHFNLGPDIGVRTAASAHFNLGPDIGVRPAASAYFNLGPDVVVRTAASAFQID